jgi:hypothetical protein
VDKSRLNQVLVGHPLMTAYPVAVLAVFRRVNLPILYIFIISGAHFMISA